MTSSLPDIMLVLTVIVGLAIILGFLIVALRGDERARHPEGRNGWLRDEALRASPTLPYLVVVLCGWISEPFQDGPFYVWLLGGSLLGMIAGHLAPPVKHARARLRALGEYPSQ